MDILLAMAVVPAAFLLWYVYKIDPVEKEPINLLLRLLGWGAVACIPAMIFETIGIEALLQGRNAYTLSELFIENFFIIALSEEVCKFFFLRWKTWNNPAFDYVFDGIVYGVFVSLGFAILENIGYVYEFGFATAVVRAFTAIPGHAIFGVFMGCFYGLAKREQHSGSQGKKMLYLVLALVLPIIGHGFYDFCASIESEVATLVFWLFLLFMMFVAMRLVKHMAKAAHKVHTADPTLYSQAAITDSAQYNPVVDNSFDAGNPTYTAPNQYGTPTPPPNNNPFSGNSTSQGPFY